MYPLSGDLLGPDALEKIKALFAKDVSQWILEEVDQLLKVADEWIGEEGADRDEPWKLYWLAVMARAVIQRKMYAHR